MSLNHTPLPLASHCEEHWSGDSFQYTLAEQHTGADAQTTHLLLYPPQYPHVFFALVEQLLRMQLSTFSTLFDSSSVHPIHWKMFPGLQQAPWMGDSKEEVSISTLLLTISCFVHISSTYIKYTVLFFLIKLVYLISSKFLKTLNRFSFHVIYYFPVVQSGRFMTSN